MCRYMASPHLGVTVAVAIAIHNIPGELGGEASADLGLARVHSHWV